MGIEQHCTKETSQRGGTLATLRPILTGPRIETQTKKRRPRAPTRCLELLTMTGRSNLK